MHFSVNSTTGIPTGSTTSAVSDFAAATESKVKPGQVSPFSDLFSNAVGQIDQLEDQARITVDRMMMGSGVDVHQAMIATQKASMAFELALAVRNKAVQAYQSVMGMQF
jgi:flagellar hook-basal body complex protein FliE